MRTPESYYKDLSQFLADLEKIFITPIEEKFGSTSLDDELHIRAYILMAHAAFEEFIENIAKATASYYEEISEKIASSEQQYSNYLLRMLQSNKKIIDDKVKRNHRLEIDELLVKPLGFSKIKDERKKTLKRLVDWRGSFAHTSNSATRIPDPKDLKSTVKEIHEICEDILKEAQELFGAQPPHTSPSA